METDRVALQALHDAVAQAQKDKEKAYTTDTHSLLIDPKILEEERQFKFSQRGGLQAMMPVDSEEEEIDDEMEDYRSVATLDSIAENADFISLE